MSAETAEALRTTLSPDSNARQRGEAYLRQAARASEQFALQLLHLSTQESTDDSARLAAAVAFKNAVKTRWASPDEESPAALGESALPPVSSHEQSTIKNHLLPLCLQSPPRIRAQLSDALCAIASSDFPSNWTSLLPSLVSHLSTSDLTSCSSVLSMCNSIFLRYRFNLKSEELFTELAYVLDSIVEPVFSLLQSITDAVPSTSDPSSLSLMFDCVYHIVEIVFSLSSIDLPEWIENRLDTLMRSFHAVLQMESPTLESNTCLDTATPLDNARASICECLRMFADKYNDEVTPYVSTFAQDAWNLLTRSNTSESKDPLVTSAMSFLTALAKGVHYELFNDASALQQICSQVVLPNMRFRSEDEQLLEMSPLDYMRRETEGSDSDTRRRMASELVNRLSERFPDTLMPALTQYITSLLQQYSADPQNKWKEKDIALQLAISLMAREVTAARGATKVNEMMDLHEFLKSHVAPEIAASTTSPLRVVRADCIRFLTVFRSQLDTRAVCGVFPALVQLTGSADTVMHSYAAFAIERLLALRDKQNGQLRFPLPELCGNQQPELLQTALHNLFASMQTDDSTENDYLMKAVMRLITSSGKNINPMAPTCIEHLSSKLEMLCKHGTNPGFAHYLFESLAAIIKTVGSDTIPHLEGYLFPPFQEILQQDIAEFAPYVFQLFALLLELRPHPIPETYTQLLNPVLTKDTWARKANVPALVKLLKAFLKAAPEQMQAQGRVDAILGVFQTLVKSKAHDHDGFMLINALLENLPVQTWQQHFTTVIGEVLSRLQHKPTQGFKSDFVIFFALCIVVLGWQQLAERLESFQRGLSLMIVQKVWIPSMCIGASHWLERKLLAVAGIRVLEECSQLRSEESDNSWESALASIVAALEGTERRADTNAVDDADSQDIEPKQYTAAYAALSMAARREADPCSDVAHPQYYLAQTLGRIQQQQPSGWVLQRVQRGLNKHLQDALSSYCSEAGVQLQ